MKSTFMSNEQFTGRQPDWNLVVLVRSSPALSAVLRELRSAAIPGLTQRGLARKASVSLGHISAHAAKLVELGLAKCLTPGVRKGRIYCATSIGISIVEAMVKLEENECGLPRDQGKTGGMKDGDKGAV